MKIRCKKCGRVLVHVSKKSRAIRGKEIMIEEGKYAIICTCGKKRVVEL